jgi:C4-dicarboxylate transporter DctM subunit
MATATEAGVVAVFYALLLGLFVYKELQIRHLPNILLQTVITSASIMIIMSVASIFSWLLADLEIPKKFAEFFTSITTNKYAILLLVNVFLLVLGTFVDMGPAIIITTPILLPLVQSVGVDPIHFGLIMIINLGIGLFTPPVGTNLYVCCVTARIGLEDISIAIVPYILAAIAILFVVTYLPQSVLWIPNLLMK